MSTVDDATATMVANFPAKTGRSLDDWLELVRASGLTRHGEIVSMLKAEHGMSHGFANLTALRALNPADAAADDPLDGIYAGAKAPLRPLHQAVVSVARGFGPDVELAPKKSYVSVRRAKQFATVGPASGGRIEVGLNLAGRESGGRLEPTSGMCTHRVRVASEAELDEELRGWLREAYDRA
jgi:Domain of unknown function (DUF4287)/Domain of unknown function (DUF5655)